MLATQQKIDWARFAIANMLEAESTRSRSHFAYHFGAFLALIGALRQFITVKPFKLQVYAMDSQDLNYCTCIDLRNVDVHVDNVMRRTRAHIDVSITSTLRSTGSLEVQHLRGGEVVASGIVEKRPSDASESAPDSDTFTVKERYYVNPVDLHEDFAVLRINQIPRSRIIKPKELSLLGEMAAAEVAQSAIDYYEHTVLPTAKHLGIPIP